MKSLCVGGVLVVGACLVGCGGSSKGKSDAPSTIDAPSGSGDTAQAVFSAVRVTTLPGASQNAGSAGVFMASDLEPGSASAPAVSNTILSALPGTPPKVMFIGQAAAFDAVEVAVEGLSGYFDVPAGDNNTLIGLDLVTVGTLPDETITVDFATRSGTEITGFTTMQLLINQHVFIAAGDLLNHDTAQSDVADLFGAVLEGNQGNPAMPAQVIVNHDNNTDIINGVKGDLGPAGSGHREVVWDGVPETLRDNGTFKEAFFDRGSGGSAGVQGGITFTPTNGTGEEVNDALNGVVPTSGPPGNPNAPLGGDFSNINPSYAGDFIAFTQDATFAPLGTTTTDLTFDVAGSDAAGVVIGAGVVFISVDASQASSIEFFDENGVSLNKTFVPPRSAGPFPVPGPLTAFPNNIPYSFAGWIDSTKRVAWVRLTNGQAAVDTATLNDRIGTPDVVVLDDIYYSEPKP